MWRRPEPPPAPSSWTPGGRHISYRIAGPEGSPSPPRSPWGSTSTWPSLAIRAPATPGRFEAARRWLCGAPDRGRAESSASTGRRRHNWLDHITAESSAAGTGTVMGLNRETVARKPCFFRRMAKVASFWGLAGRPGNDMPVTSMEKDGVLDTEPERAVERQTQRIAALAPTTVRNRPENGVPKGFVRVCHLSHNRRVHF
jgi:hypothetical protein